MFLSTNSELFLRENGMSRGRKPRAKDDGSAIPINPPAVLITDHEKDAYSRLRSALARVGTSRGSDLELVVIAAKRIARLQMLYQKLDIVISADQLIMGATESTV
jgi:hypothetical protein